MTFSFGVIGLGKMAQLILRSLLEADKFKSEEVFGVVGQPGSIKRAAKCFSTDFLIVDAKDPRGNQVWDLPVKLLAVKPQQLTQIKENCTSSINSASVQKPLLISILAGVKLDRLQALFPSHACVRAVPNTPALVSSGVTGLSWGDDVSAAQQRLVVEFFQPISKVYELPEDQLDAFLALTSSGPAYLALVSEALADGAVAAGLPRHLSNTLTHATIEGTVRLLKEKELHPGQLKDMVASPAGTTIRALRHLEKKGVRSALIEAVVLAAKRSRELS